MAYRIATGLFLALFGFTWWAAYTGWGLPTTSAVEARRKEIENRRSARLGYVGSGPRYGK
jgi:hypothetical protein